MAVTAHWLDLDQAQGSSNKITLRAGLIGFLYIAEHHSGENLGITLYFLITRMKLQQKVRYVLS